MLENVFPGTGHSARMSTTWAAATGTALKSWGVAGSAAPEQTWVLGGVDSVSSSPPHATAQGAAPGPSGASLPGGTPTSQETTGRKI